MKSEEESLKQAFLFLQGIDEFNNQQFYQCHNTLESIWLEAKEPDKTFYQGILQISVGCYHLEQLNWKGSVILLGEGIKKLRDYQPSYQELDIANFLKYSSIFLKTIQATKPEDIRQESENFKTLFPRIVKIDLNISNQRS